MGVNLGYALGLPLPEPRQTLLVPVNPSLRKCPKEQNKLEEAEEALEP